jgi:hypothetical protein
MINTAKWKHLILAASLLPLLANGCATTFRDAVWSGAIDFVSGSVTAILEALLPIARVLTPA